MFKYAIIILSLVLISACEYERIEKDSACDSNPITLTIQSVENTECGLDEGVIVVQAEDGQESLVYSINGETFTTDNIFRNLAAGTYNLVARDMATGCESQIQTQEILNEGGLQINVASLEKNTCGNSNGRISVSQENGVAPIQYQLNDGEFQTDNIFEGLGSGTYQINAIDANGCESFISNIEISSETSLTDHVQPIIMVNCAVSGCHNGSVSPNLESKEAIINNSSRIKSRTGSGTMPPAGRTDLSDEQINLIACWVDEGSLNN